MTLKTLTSRYLIASLLACAPAAALSEEVDVAIRSDAVSWNVAAHEGGVVTISGPAGFRAELPFAEGATPSFVPGLEDEPLVDGSYRWEVALQGLGRTSGAFTLKNGALVLPSGAEAGAGKSEQILDDLIVQGSLCVGMECLADETFGFDTVRLKENNLRIKFEDDSSTFSFPSNDWSLVINDTNNGGASHFSIEDTTAGTVPFSVAAGAPNTGLFVGEQGVGFGTSTPASRLHAVTGNSPALRLEQDTSEGFGAQAWDVAGNESYFFVRDITQGGTDPFRIKPGSRTNALTLAGDRVGIGLADPATSVHIQDDAPALRLDSGTRQWDLSADDVAMRVEDSTAGTVPFRIEAGAPGAALTVDDNGRVGMGTSNPQEQLHIKNDGTTRIRFEHTDGVDWSVGSHSSSFVITRPGSGGNELELRNSGDIVFRYGGRELARLNKYGNLTTAGTVNGTSDVHRKRDFAAVDTGTALARVASLPISMWSYKNDAPGVRHLGPMAQDFYAAFGLGVDERHIAASDLAGVALAAIQELSLENAAKDRELEAMGARLTALEALLGLAD